MRTRFLRFLLSLVLPADCALCGGVLPASSDGVCAACEASIGFLEPPFCAACGRPDAGGRCAGCDGALPHLDRAYACAYYEGPSRELLRLYKFSRRRSLGAFFARRMARFARAHVPGAGAFDAAVAVPLDARKERERGFNQSERVARLVARELGIPHVPRAMRRSPSPSPQSLLPRARRGTNVAGRFSVRDAAALRGRRVLLVDDVLTTGHTASECARALKEAGAASVVALACARGA